MEYFKVRSNKGNLIKGPLIIKPKIFLDYRGYFFESWNQSEFNHIISRQVNFVQDNHSESKLGVLRGLHYQLNPKAQGKLVRCTKGEIFDVLVDIRKNSDTYGEWYGIVLNEENKLQFWIPEGFAHGFISLKESSEVQYKTNEYWDKDHERSLFWKDDELKIDWPIEDRNGKFKILINDKDANAPKLNQIEESGELL
ncbi:dTDP-4-dehydrorhamnose 3,5-epimerase [Prochlorococcus marinus str. XMU1401]|uniref:dTDP-4-dehydrorhamnose 3,5-epimerase n=1 Tax=Prochlorococcus marinus str. XMU1401 TaxID=2052594 RepID=A0A8I1X0P5_PROMR|nr:dTDP-4-dehydrorhamnose 3,5-epimerase [Prochlorococcus marinus]MBO8223276.1 dTDP-4-dehydrorhamnose 3,5-epimerase [Prochlorococcus marinus str. XMU1401]MBW3059808.1 dTDP-4-dehydrorhamnose 3,5-epimerase [Prochlorococcus marinus str. XMU1401E]MCQ9198966.1 dTDP-4-dehydrorhamnose 3,5-epimerase [Prochlorococcus marinus XMU1429]PJC83622.1 dTDP-4-dehydrorhamnose 3,5-epimerase [Prochlorococcus marinus str. XMU1401]